MEFSAITLFNLQLHKKVKNFDKFTDMNVNTFKTLHILTFKNNFNAYLIECMT